MSATAFTGVTLRAMTGDAAEPNRTVLVRDGRIAGIERGVVTPPGFDVIDGAGKVLMPGLCDMHVHITAARLTDGMVPLDETEAMRRSREYLFMFLEGGVTTVRNMAGTPRHLRLRAEVTAGTTPGPRIVTAGPILEQRFTWPGLAAIARLVRSPEEGRTAVREGLAEGYDFVKLYNDIDVDVYDAIMAEARAAGLQVVGHVAFAKGLDGALAARQDSIEHLRSYDFAADTRPNPPGRRFEGWLHATPARLAELAARTSAAGVWNCPTLVIDAGCVPDGVAPDPVDLTGVPRWMAEMLAIDSMAGVFTNEQRTAIWSTRGSRGDMVAALDRAGAKLLAGTDCPVYGLVPGRSLLRELELFVDAGLSPLHALQAATTGPAEFLGIAHEAGTVEIGKRADLLLLDGDPVVDLSAIRRQIGVMAAGTWWPAAALRAAIARFDREPATP